MGTLKSKIRSSRRLAVFLVVAAVIVLTIGIASYALTTHAPRIFELQLAGSSVPSVLTAVGAMTPAYVSALRFGFGLIAAYVIAIGTAATLGWALSYTRSGRLLSTWAIFGAVGAGLCDVGANACLLIFLNHRGLIGLAITPSPPQRTSTPVARLSSITPAGMGDTSLTGSGSGALR